MFQRFTSAVVTSWYSLIGIKDKRRLRAKIDKLITKIKFNKTESDLSLYCADSIDKVIRTYDEYIKLGAKEFQNACYISACTRYRAAIKLRPKDPLGYLNLGACYQELEQWTKAIEQFQQVIWLDNGLTTYARQGIAECVQCVNNGDKFKPLSLVDKAKQASLDQYWADFLGHTANTKHLEADELRIKLGNTYESLGNERNWSKRYTDAIHAYRSALAYSSKNKPRIYLSIGTAYFNLGNYDLALSTLNNALPITNSYLCASVWFWRGECFKAKNDISSALANYEAVLLKNPGHMYAALCIDRIKELKA